MYSTLSTSYTKRSSDTAGTVLKPITNGMNYTRRGNSVGVNIIVGGTSTTSVGTTSETGMTVITIATEPGVF